MSELAVRALTGSLRKHSYNRALVAAAIELGPSELRIIPSTDWASCRIPGPLKIAIDWASGPAATWPFKSKPALIIGASTGEGGRRFALEGREGSGLPWLCGWSR